MSRARRPPPGNRIDLRILALPSRNKFVRASCSPTDRGGWSTRATSRARLYATATQTKSSRPEARLRSPLGVAIDPFKCPLLVSVAIRRVGGFVLIVLAHSKQPLFYVGCSRSAGLRMEQLCELEQFIFTGHFCFTSCSFLTPRRSLNNAARQGVVPRQCQWNCGRRGVIGGSRTD